MRDDEINFILAGASHNKLEDLMKLGYYNYYGMKTFKRNFTKAFDYFWRAA